MTNDTEDNTEDNTFLVFSDTPVNFQEEPKMQKFYAVYKDEDGRYEVWGGPYIDENFAMVKAEENLLTTYGSRSPKYRQRLPRLFHITENRAKEVGAVS
jgi:hypothetical protein